MTYGGRHYVHDSAGIAGFVASWRIAHLALQPILGILPERWLGTRCGCSPRLAASWTVVNRGQSVEVF